MEPEHQTSLIERSQTGGEMELCFGDGINNTITLKKTNISTSLNNASAVAVDTAETIFINRSLNPLTDA